MQENKYIGDEKMIKMLEHYKCPTPLDVVKMRFVGAICSPNLELRPTDVISSFWPSGKAPRLQTKDEADLFFKFFMGLWDDIFERVKNNKIKLEKLSYKDLFEYFERRFVCIEQGFVEGFWGGNTDIKMPAYLAKLIDSMSELSGAYSGLNYKLAKGGNKEEITTALKSVDAMVEKTIAYIIEKLIPSLEKADTN